MYEVLILFKSDTGLRLTTLEEAVRDLFESLNPAEKVQTEIRGGQLAIAIGSFRFYVSRNCGETVAAESRDMAKRFAEGRPDADDIAAADCRLEVSSDPDHGGDQFNNFVFLMEAAEGMGQVYLFDPAAGGFV